jgi:hypothetical protein
MAHETAVRLTQVYPLPGDDQKTDIDIIAIHGLDTKSPDTWVWKSKIPPKNVNWLKDKHMLPTKVENARIFTCDWPAVLLQESISSSSTALEHSASCLLESIRQLLAANKMVGPHRPILFIASCLGGIILIKALDIDDSYDHNEQDPAPLKKATRGIVFMATPFRGTSFKEMPIIPFYAWANSNGRTVSALINYTRNPTSQVGDLVNKFMLLQQQKDYHVFAFCEGRKTALLRKVHLAEVFSNRALLAWFLGLLFVWWIRRLSLWQLGLFFFWWLGNRSYQPKLVSSRPIIIFYILALSSEIRYKWMLTPTSWLM